MKQSSFYSNIEAARRFRSINDIKEAIKHYKLAIALKPNDLDLRYELGVYAGATSHFLEAKEQFHYLVKKTKAPILHANYALSLADLGEYEKAIQHFEIAIKSDFSLDHFRYPLAECLRKSAHFEDAIAQFHLILRKEPKHAASFFSLGLIYSDQQDIPKSLEAFEKACQFDPNNKNYQLFFIRTLLTAGLHDEALKKLSSLSVRFPNSIETIRLELKCYDVIGDAVQQRRLFDLALAKFPDNLDLLYDYAEFLFEGDEFQLALAVYDKILSAEPNHQLACLSKINLLLKMGENTKAEQITYSFIEKNPDSFEVKSKLIEFSSFDEAEKLIVDLETAQIDLNSHHIALQLANYFKKIGDFDKAFKYYESSKKLFMPPRAILQDFEFELEKLTNDLDKFKYLYAKGLLNSVANLTKKPVFIVGMSSSGKSLLADLLSCHSQIDNLDEVKFFEEYLSYELLNGSQEESIEKIKSSANLYLNKIETSSSKKNVERIINTYPYNFRFVGYLAKMYPNACIYHTFRNPIDNCLQIYFKHYKSGHFYTYDLEKIAKVYEKYQSMMSYWNMTFPNRVQDVPFESLVKDTKTTFYNLIKAMELDGVDSLVDLTKLNQLAEKYAKFNKELNLSNNYEKYIGQLKRVFIKE